MICSTVLIKKDFGIPVDDMGIRARKVINAKGFTIMIT
jgi:hypothetical protein